MEPFDRTDPAGQPFRRRQRTIGSGLLLERERPAIQTPQTYVVCDGMTEVLLHFLIIFTPWAFGTTELWSIWTMNIAAYALGGLLLIKWLIRWRTGFELIRWGTDSRAREILAIREKGFRIFTHSLAALTVLVLTYCLVSASNARATYLPGHHRFEYHDYIRWLPHSYDSTSTWNALWSYVSMALVFWAVRDWTLGKTSRECRETQLEKPASQPGFSTSAFGPGGSSPPQPRHRELIVVPSRLRRLLWVLCINGALVALEGILQRLDGTNKLLWLVEPRFNNTAESQFGPYAYRANAAAYLNLIWPVCIGFWFALNSHPSLNNSSGRRLGAGSHVMLLPCAVVIAASSIITTSRGGALTTLAMMLGATGVFLATTRRESILLRTSVLATFVVILGLAGYLGWQQLRPRLEIVPPDDVGQRTEIYKNAEVVSRDFPIFGTGPGTFGSIYQLYKDPIQIWAAYAHDDWLETRITFGWAGFSLILAMVCLVFLGWFFGDGISSPPGFVAMMWLSLAGCLVHAKFDFPFQIHSVLLLFILFCSLLFCLSRKKSSPARTRLQHSSGG